MLLGAQDGQGAEPTAQASAGKAKSDLHQIWMAATRDEAHAAFRTFVQTCEPKR